MISKLVVVFCTLAAWTDLYALTYQKAFQLVAEQGESLNYNHSNHGALCEVLAVAKMQEVFPDSEIVSGIKYAPEGGSVMGELDVVVMNEGTADMVIEVKCMRSFGSAASKADKQLKRFAGVAGRCDFNYWGEGETYDCFDFQNKSKTFHKMSYEDAGSYGFDLSFDLSRSEILNLISDLSARY